MTWKEQQELKRIKASERWLWQPRFYGADTELVVFPGPYNVGIANLGYQFLLSRLLQLNKSFDRFFIDPRLPSATSLDTERSLLDYGRWDITLPFEENLLELIKLLMKLDIPLEA
ncbi:MAG: radical SAM protein, partial [Coprothermobacter proteolyticus]